MAKYSAIKAAVNAYIKANGKKEITGSNLNSVLNATIDSLGKEFQFGGVLTPADDPGQPDQNVAYIGAAGTYPNFDNLVIASGNIGIFLWNGDWSFVMIPVGKDYDNDIQSLTNELQELSDSLRNNVQELSENIQELSDDVIHLDGINEEDLSIPDEGKLQFANRVYNAQQPNGMGYVILRKNKTFAEQVTGTNTIYEIRDVFDLNNSTHTIPSGCILRFCGGKITNGTLDFGETLIEAADVVVFDGVTITNCTSTQEIKATWFGFTVSGNRNSSILQNLGDNFVFIKIDPGTYEMESAVTFTSDSRTREIKGFLAEQGHTRPTLHFANSNGFILKKRMLLYGLAFSGNKGTYDSNQGVYINGYVGIDLWAGAEIIGCDIYGWMIGVDTYNGNVIAGIFRKLTISKCGNYGFRIHSNSETGSVNANILESCYFVNNGNGGLDYGTQSTKTVCGVALYILGGAGNTIINNVFEYNSGVGLFVDRPTTISDIKGFSVIGNYFEYNKYANAYVDINTPNSVIVSDIVFRGNIYSDANRTLAPDSCVNRRCAILDVFGLLFRKNLIFDDVDKTLWMTYSDGVILDSDLLKKYNSEWGTFDSANNTLKIDYDHRSNQVEFPIGILKPGLYRVSVVVKWVSGGQRNLQINYKVDSGSTIALNQTIFSSWSTYREVAFSTPIVISKPNSLFRIISINMTGSSSGDEINVQSVLITQSDSVTTTQRNNLTPFNGLKVYDLTLKKWLIYNGTDWVDVNGFPAVTSVGATADRPSASAVGAGFTYFDTDLGKMIVSNGIDWVNMDGTNLS